MFKAWKHRTDEVELTVSNRTIVRVLVMVLVSVLFFAALRRASHALILIFTAFFLSLALNAPVHWIAERLPGKRKGSRTVATAASFLLVVVVLGVFLASIVPPIVRQTSTFINSAPHLVDSVRNQNGELGSLVRKYHLEAQVNTFSKQLSTRLSHASGAAVSTITRIGSSIFATLTILVLTFMMLIEGPYWLNGFVKLLPDERRQKHVREVAAAMYHVIRGYVNGQVLLAAIASALIVPMLFILHISYPVALMLLIFVCGLIPMVGHTIGAIIVTGIAAFHSIPSAFIILAYYILYQQIENYVIQPHIQANTTNLSPLLVFTALVIGVSFGGLLGGLVAIPIMGCLRVFVIDQLERRHMLSSKDVTKLEAVDTK
jgi:predicted PurR-regulated permease PerM